MPYKREEVNTLISPNSEDNNDDTNHPFFKDFIKTLYPAYIFLSYQQLSTNMLNSEISHIQLKIDAILKNEICAMLESHTSFFIAEKIIEVIELVGSEKFLVIVSNNIAFMVKAKKLFWLEPSGIALEFRLGPLGTTLEISAWTFWNCLEGFQ
ncbi:hypothetical protein C1645_823918 [Glomus cerebriforme]|uniref:Uncharacterized protein n=1 Tax=Glomus cerebriforme TaxID=658196 RepID=A0A397SWL6_9GLOM|nr:hypothetical protein C1645_823918 [Glomus cerebriforme]